MPLPGACTSPASQSILIIQQWATEIGASKSQTRQLLLLVDKEYLLKKVVRKGLKRVDSPRGLRFLFRYHAAKILGWRHRLQEGHPLGFSDAVNETLRLILWPDIGCP